MSDKQKEPVELRASEAYKFVEKPSSDLYSIEITTGPFAGVIFTYGKVKIDPPTLKFDYVIEKVSSHLDKKLLESLPEFKNLLGDILHDILSTA
jgi:hypothetical protein